jgi:hypothetical protein
MHMTTIIVMTKRFFSSHAGKGTAGVLLADLFIAWPDALSWMVAGCALWWAIQHFRQAFRSLDAESEPMEEVTVTATAEVTPLDRATQHENLPAVVPGWEIVPAETPPEDEAAHWERRSA